MPSTDDGDPATDATLTAPVYWVGERPTGLYLYREFRAVEDVGDPVTAAVAATMGMRPLDPDYLTAWQPPTRLEVTRDGDAITVDVSPDAFANSSVGTELAELSVQQVVWTATAAAQRPGPVTILVDGSAYDAWGAVALGEPMDRDAAAQAFLWLDSPLEGAEVGAGAVEFAGAADVFEGHVAWEVTDADGVVATGSAQAAMGDFVPYVFTVELAPGEYTVAVWSPDESGGESPEGPRMWEQTRDFSVR